MNPRPSVVIDAAGVFVASALGLPQPSRIDPPPDAAGQDERHPGRALRAEERRLARRFVVARDSAAWWVWLASLRERVAARVDANDVGDGLTPAAFSLVIAAGARAANASDEAMCTASEADMYSVAAQAEAAGIHGAPNERWERKAAGARVRALRSIARDAVRWEWRAYLSAGFELDWAAVARADNARTVYVAAARRAGVVPESVLRAVAS